MTKAASRALTILQRHGLTIADAAEMSDDELLGLPYFGQGSLAWVRTQTNGAKPEAAEAEHVPAAEARDLPNAWRPYP